MKASSFLADDANTALAQVHEQLGPEAIVVSVRRLPVPGLARLWQRKGRIEVLAVVPERTAEDPVAGLVTGAGLQEPLPFDVESVPETGPGAAPRRWRSLARLESLGLIAALADRLEGQLVARHGDVPPPGAVDEWNLVQELLSGHWRAAAPIAAGTGRPHVFLGPPGSGKTTVLCKWMTQALFAEDRTVQAWRLDGATANTAELLTVHCEMIGVPAERVWAAPRSPADLCFVDLPGVEANDAQGLAMLRDQLALLPQPHIHLVLNAAYETPVLFDQFRAFAPLGPEDLIFTHLDEAPQRVKMWNFVLGTNCTLSFLAAGQKIPGEFRRAEPGLLFRR